jgi:hypothetical protein
MGNLTEMMMKITIIPYPLCAIISYPVNPRNIQYMMHGAFRCPSYILPDPLLLAGRNFVFIRKIM